MMQTLVRSVTPILFLLAASCGGPVVRDTKAPDCYTPGQFEGTYPVTIAYTYSDSDAGTEEGEFDYDVYINQTGVAISYVGLLGVAGEESIDLADTSEDIWWGIPLTQVVEGYVTTTSGEFTLSGEMYFAETDSTFSYTYKYVVSPRG